MTSVIAAALVAGPGAVAPVAAATASPSAVDFGNVAVGTSATRNVVVTIDAGFTVTAATGTGINPPFNFDFGTCTSTSTGSCTVTSKVTPTAPGAFNGTVNVIECPTATGQCTTVPFTLTGVGVLVASANPTSIDFGSVPVGTTATRNVTLTVDAGYQIFSAAGSGINIPFDFDFGACGTNPTGPCTITESFTPTALGPANGTLNVFECPLVGGACSAITVSVTGTGVPARATPTISTQASVGNVLGAPVRDVATLANGSSPTGTVTFRLFSNAGCSTEVFSSTNPVSGTTASSDWFVPPAAGTYWWTAFYGGDPGNAEATSPCQAPNESVTITPFQAPAPTRTISGDLLGPVTVNAGESVLITSGSRVVGPVTLNPGGALSVVGAQISRGIVANAPSFFSLCGTSVSGPSPATALSVSNATAPIRVGDPDAGCAGNRFAGQVSITNNVGVTFGANQVSHNATIDTNGPGKTVVKANTVFGTLACTGNSPPPVNAGQPNTGGPKTGQCAGL